MRREDQAQPTQAKRSSLPHWLDVQTIALVGSIVALGVFGQNGFSSMRQDMNAMRQELRTDLRRLEDRTRAVEVAVVGNSVRLDNLERVVGDIRGLAEAAKPETDAGCEHLAQSQ